LLNDQIGKNEMGGKCGTMIDGRGTYRVLVVKRQGKRPHGGYRPRWRIILKWIFKMWGGEH
jgi:hypothetical protein